MLNAVNNYPIAEASEDYEKANYWDEELVTLKADEALTF